MTEEVTTQTTEEVLNSALIDLIGGVTSGVGQAKDFLIQEIPDVAQQALLYYGVYHAMMMVFSILIFVGLYKAGKLIFVNRPDWWENIEDISDELVYVPVIVVTVLCLIVAVSCMNMQWLKIWLAPKLWLIEYAASLT